ncbi:unknown [[Mannheimia] succiniciproducens MBEL55E]|uniref:Uncharacterized protein n=1 Tax=Mannheimia succiniciproducens (strain KCTC 0769BP / MBEL55E) TaxID=221988 RepID=Q65RD8_MANSM|nr:unknown [[Mannheimia] succiniciproducens MBEL55E]
MGAKLLPYFDNANAISLHSFPRNVGEVQQGGGKILTISHCMTAPLFTRVNKKSDCFVIKVRSILEKFCW